MDSDEGKNATVWVLPKAKMHFGAASILLEGNAQDFTGCKITVKRNPYEVTK